MTCKMYKNTLNSSLGESLDRPWNEKSRKISLELKLQTPPSLKEVLALRIVFGHEALGVLPGVDGGRV